MKRFAVWLAASSDAAIALILALFIGILGVVSTVNAEVVSNATLVVLGLLSTSILRDRWRREPVEREMRDTLRRTAGALAALPERLERVERLDTLVQTTQRALAESSLVRVVSGADVSQVLADARRGTDRWIFKGGTGTYIRAVTLPSCVENARAERRTLLVRLEIIDPTDEELCDVYARHRRSLSDVPDSTGEPWTRDRTRKEAFATVLAACWYRQRFRMLDIDIGLSSAMSTLRWDLSASCVIITQENPQGAAVVADRGKFYYDWCSTELLTSLDQARRVPIEQARSTSLSDEPTVEEVRKLFEDLGIALPRSFTDRDVIDITRKALRAKNPYE
jgi:hypothetical protein